VHHTTAQRSALITENGGDCRILHLRSRRSCRRRPEIGLSTTSPLLCFLGPAAGSVVPPGSSHCGASAAIWEGPVLMMLLPNRTHRSLLPPR
jgi:hypothetical protein